MKKSQLIPFSISFLFAIAVLVASTSTLAQKPAPQEPQSNTYEAALLEFGLIGIGYTYIFNKSFLSEMGALLNHCNLSTFNARRCAVRQVLFNVCFSVAFLHVNKRINYQNIRSSSS